MKGCCVMTEICTLYVLKNTSGWLALRYSVTSKNNGILTVTSERTKLIVFYIYIHYLVCLMTLFIAKYSTELECGRNSLWFNLTCLEGLREGKYACTRKRIANHQVYAAHHEGREALYGVGASVRLMCFNLGKETGYHMFGRRGGSLTGRNNIAFFEVRTQHLPRNESYRLHYPGRHSRFTTGNHVLVTKLKIFCTLCCWFSLDVFFMDWCFNRVKWETLTYLERCQWNFCFGKLKTCQSYGARPENKNRWGVKCIHFI